ncbi:hypothetical protein [Staphylococcus sp. Marseille-Q6910]|uniref:hypothetical protein n=1 Tax=Staphylococcus sp. Marseille-Q6910 TaxID=2937990 RepID=UPI00203EB73B|nr:hypothetical protein [Staphylococcus sp. Marseille-Q6910]
MDLMVLSDYELLTRFNRRYMECHIQDIQYDINTMYERNLPHLVCDANSEMIYYESFSLENLAISIMEQKAKLEKYIRKCEYHLNLLEKATASYTNAEKDAIQQFFDSDGKQSHPVISRLKHDLMDLLNYYRNQRNMAVNDEIQARKRLRIERGKARKRAKLERLKKERRNRKEVAY